jgi:hypothetical protein
VTEDFVNNRGALPCHPTKHKRVGRLIVSGPKQSQHGDGSIGLGTRNSSAARDTLSQQIGFVDSALAGGAGKAFAFESNTALALWLISGIVAPLKHRLTVDPRL